MPDNLDVAIIGGGAAGLMCALTAGRRGKRVRVLEHANRVGKKILMSGGGRCNFTNTGTTPANFLSANPHYCKSALARYTPGNFIDMVDAHSIAWHEKELGQLFCDDSSKQIVRMLLDECATAGVQVQTSCSIEGVQQIEGGFRLETSRGAIDCPVLVVATGGLSIPSMGATGFGYELARQFGHTVLPTRAGLVPLTLSGKHQEHLQDLSGVALPVEIHCNGRRFRADMLITHRGLSGPAILQISSYWQPGDDLRLDLLPDTDAYAFLLDQQSQRSAAELKSVLAEVLPKRLAQRLCDLRFGSKPMRQYREAELRQIADQLKAWPIIASGIGEVVDVTGHLGGYNFQWAWASGHAAGSAI